MQDVGETRDAVEGPMPDFDVAAPAEGTGGAGEAASAAQRSVEASAAQTPRQEATADCSAEEGTAERGSCVTFERADETVQLQLIVSSGGCVAVALVVAGGRRTGQRAEAAEPGGRHSFTHIGAPEQQQCAGSSPCVAPERAEQEEAHEPAAAEEGLAGLLAENRALQCLTRQCLDRHSRASRKPLQEAVGGAQESSQQQQRYTLGLAQLGRQLAQKAEAEAGVARLLQPEQARLGLAQQRAGAQKGAFLQLVQDVAAASHAKLAAAAGGKGGKAAVSERLLSYFLSMEPAKAAAVAALRVAAATLAFQVARAEQALREGEQLGESIHLLDFEQLRIEKAALANKTEARGAEVQKLSGRLAEGIQIAAHLKQKLHAAEQERAALAARLQAAQAGLQQQRARVAAAKQRRAELKAEKEELAQEWGTVTDARCLADMQAQERELEALTAQAAALQQRLAAAAPAH